jgi:hypothetical protein
MFLKKGFPFFELSYAHLHSKFRKNAKKNKKKFSSKIQFGYQKTQNFTLISNLYEKFLKNLQKKL